MLCRALVVAVVGVAVTPAPAAAASLDWHAPASCPDAASLRQRVEQRINRSLDDVLVAVAIEVSLAAGRYTARVDLGAVTVANDVRTLTSARCSELTDAVAVIVARVASDAIAHGQTRVVRPAPARRVAVRDDGDPGLVDSPTPAARGPRVPRPWTVGVRLGGISGIGVIPKVGLGAELVATVRISNHLAELGASRWLASAAQLHDGAPAKLNIELDAATVRYGWRPPIMPLRAWVAVEVGNMHGAGVQLPTAQLESGRWVAAGAGFGIAWQMSPWARLVGATETLLAIERVRFAMGDGIVVYAPSPMSVRATCGLEVGWQ